MHLELYNLLFGAQWLCVYTPIVVVMLHWLSSHRYYPYFEIWQSLKMSWKILWRRRQVHYCGAHRNNALTVFPQLERAHSINCRLAPRGVVFEGAL